MVVSYLLQEDGAGKILLEDSGALLLEGGDAARPLINGGLLDDSNLFTGLMPMAGPHKEAPFSSIVRFFFTTNNAAGAAVAPSGNFDGDDVRVYEDSNGTEITAGITVTSPFDTVTGLHLVAIDLSDGAFASSLGKNYTVVFKSPDHTVDSQTVVAVIGSFRVVLPELTAGLPSAGVIQVNTDAINAAAIADGAIDAGAVDSSAAQKIASYNIPPASTRNTERASEGGRRGASRRASTRNSERHDGEGSAR